MSAAATFAGPLTVDGRTHTLLCGCQYVEEMLGTATATNVCRGLTSRVLYQACYNASEQGVARCI